MCEYLVTNVIDGDLQYNVESKLVGGAELRSSGYDTPQERDALKTSALKNKENVDLDLSMRLSVIVTADDSSTAFVTAQELFSETLDIGSIFDSVLSHSVRITTCAFSINLTTQEIIPFVRQSIPMNCFVRHFGPLRPITLSQIVSGRNDNFTRRVRRFCHWLRKSSVEEDRQLKILFLWFSLEALLKENQSDNIISFVGMLIGFCSTSQSPEAWRAIRTDAHYGEYQKFFLKKLDEIREFRNDSVHSGFVPWDISNEDAKLYFFILNSATMRAVASLTAYYVESHSTCDVTDFKSFIKQSVPTLPNFKNWFEGTFLYMFTQKDFLKSFLNDGCIK